MTDSYVKDLLREGRAKKLRELADLASKDRTPSEAKRFAAEARAILLQLAEVDKQLSTTDGLVDSPDYSKDRNVNVSIVRYLKELERPVTESELIKELIRGQYPGYKNAKDIGISVGRCARAYDRGVAKVNPKLKYKNRLVGLPEWPDEMFS
jgi:hypothetical protein